MEWYIAKKLNTVPTDIRLMEVSKENLRILFWAYLLDEMRATALRNEMTADTLEEVLAGVTIEERMAKVDAALERQAKETQKRDEERQKAAGAADRTSVAHQLADREGDPVFTFEGTPR